MARKLENGSSEQAKRRGGKRLFWAAVAAVCAVAVFACALLRPWDAAMNAPAVAVPVTPRISPGGGGAERTDARQPEGQTGEPAAIPVESISLGGDLTLSSGDTAVLSAEVRPEGAAGEPIVWSSSAPFVARVDADGGVTAWARGEAEITASAGGASATVRVTVPDGPEAPQNVPPARYIEEGGAYRNPGAAREGEATLMLTGDLMCLSAQIGAAKTGGGYDFTGSFSRVKELFSQADFVMGNLETSVSYTQPYTQPAPAAPPETPAEAWAEATPAPRVMPVLNTPAAYLDALRYAGVDAVSTANNHCCDAGAEGIENTLDALGAYGFLHAGTRESARAPYWFLAEVGGIRVGFLAYSEFFNGKDAQLSEEQRGFMIGRYSEEQMKRDVGALKTAGAEFVIAYTHWGDENMPVTGAQKEHARQLADAGVDVIAGSHPHILQPAEYIKAADGRRVLCFYSLGNFVSSMGQPAHNDTVVAELKLEKDGGGARLVGAAYYPCRVRGTAASAFTVVPLDGGDEGFARIAGVVGDQIEAKAAWADILALPPAD